MPGPISDSIKGNTLLRTFTLVNFSFSLCGSFQGFNSASKLAATVCSRVIFKNGRAYFPLTTAMPERERVPEPRAKPSKTVSA